MKIIQLTIRNGFRIQACPFDMLSLFLIRKITDIKSILAERVVF